ncbi:SDR family NAD(P)-dependent oxidoreductase [Rhodococcus pyridinivorans]|uniref:SDR family NAD(P)-dependent oxidoreductase n=1 Tax=Rhodococcus pyridinivorans TaxID=103816 RepID=UPI002283D6C1|nr:SDR family oxidoreductase [Rhodococcus pyridinivorans]WAL45949.1 SDR family oxidoreductase [Rhodococcus pyridinivorans]
MGQLDSLHDLSGKTAVVTGGSRGIGRAIAQILAEHGADVVVASRKLDACELAAKEIEASTGSKVLPVACHVGQWDDCNTLVDTTLDHFGRLDILVNNAGMSPLYRDLESITEELYDKTFGVNLKGPFRLAVRAGTYMAEHDGGSIVNIGTAGSLTASVRELPYACAKAGLNALTVGLAEAYAPKVRVNSILPGPFRTDLSKAWAPPEGEEASFVPLRRMGRPEEVAPLALHLASDASSFTTGAIIRVDGGVTRKV